MVLKVNREIYNQLRTITVFALKSLVLESDSLLKGELLNWSCISEPVPRSLAGLSLELPEAFGGRTTRWSEQRYTAQKGVYVIGSAD